MFKRIAALILAFVMLGTCFAIAEDAQPEVKTPETAYEEWFLMVEPLLYAGYADSTWISNTILDYKTHLQVTYLLKKDVLTFTEEELDSFSVATDRSMESLYRMHEFIHTLPATLATVRLLKADMVTEVPAKYEYVDSLIEKLMTDIEKLRTELVEHIEVNSTLQDFPTGTGSTKERVSQTWQRIEWIYNFMN